MRPYRVLPSPLRPVLKAGNLVSDIPLAQNSEPNSLGEFALLQNFPNPFNDVTEIRFRLPEAMHVQLVLFNMMGQKIKVLLDKFAPAGNNTVTINKSGLEKGIYYYQLSAGSHIDSKKLIVN
jgi:hypothetical protein